MVSDVANASKTDNKNINDQIKELSWYKNTINANGKPVWSIPMKNIVSNSNNLIISKSILVKDNISGKALGVLQINLDENKFSNSINDAKIEKSGSIFIINQDGYVLASNNTKQVGENISNDVISKITNEVEGNFEFKRAGINTYGVYSTDDAKEWRFVAVVPKSELSATATSIGIVSLLFTLVSIVTSIIILTRTTLQITIPIREIIYSTKAQECFKIEFKEVNNTIKYFDSIKVSVNNINDLVKTSKSSIGAINEQKKNSLKQLQRLQL